MKKNIGKIKAKNEKTWENKGKKLKKNIGKMNAKNEKRRKTKLKKEKKKHRKNVETTHRHKRIHHRLLIGPACLPCFG
jgi:hypothetical protein